MYADFGGFVSGIGIRYAPSAIVDAAHQAAAATLVVGERVPPQTFVRAADVRPVDVQDVLPADTRYKVLVFAGDTRAPPQRARVQALADAVAQGFLQRFGGPEPGKVFDVLAISSAPKDKVDYTDLPPVFRTHWSK